MILFLAALHGEREKSTGSYCEHGDVWLEKVIAVEILEQE